MQEYLVKVYKEARELKSPGQPEIKECFTVFGDKVFEIIQARKEEKIAVFLVGKPLVDFS
jgi:hypothetical protein